MALRTIDYKNNRVKIIDQTLLPGKLAYLEIKTLPRLWRAIKTLQVRGAPALGAAAALGMYLGIKDFSGTSAQLIRKLEKTARYIGSSRPTARNLFWGLERILAKARASQTLGPVKIKKLILEEARAIMREDAQICRLMGKAGADLIKNNSRVLTICNAGILATIDYGTALGVVYSAKAQGKKFKVFSCETRPLLQGSRLSCWEMHKQGVDVTMIADNSAASLMAQGMVDLVITGADRIAANGDAANKIGTFNLAVLARFHKVPFYIAAPQSTFDPSAASKEAIKVELRDPKEVSTILFKKEAAPAGASVFNPAFDIVPHELISGIITERGIIRPPFKKNIRKTFFKNEK